MSLSIEQYVPPILQNGGITTSLPVTINSDLTVTGTTNIGGISLTDLTTTGNTILGNATSDTLTVNGNSTFTGTATGTMVDAVVTTTSTGIGLDLTGNTALTTGQLLTIASSATAITTTGRLFLSTHSGATVTSGILNEFTSAAADEAIVLKVAGTAAITGSVLQASATSTVTGIIIESVATAGTLTTGRYFSANNATTEVFGIGLNGHIISTVSASPPTIAVTSQNGITAAAITAGGTDTCGIITTTGTNNNGGTSVLQVTFGKTYTTAPKAVLLFPRNSAGSKTAATSLLNVFISAITATTFDITIPQDAGAIATPSWNYVVIA